MENRAKTSQKHFELIWPNKFKKDYKKIAAGDSKIKIIIGQHLAKIQKNYLIGWPPLKGYPNWLKIQFNIFGIPYRLIYQVYKKERKIILIAIGKRSKIYKKISRI